MGSATATSAKQPTFADYFQKSPPGQRQTGPSSLTPYLMVNGVAWLFVLGIVLHDSSMLVSAVLSATLFSGGLSWLITEHTKRSLEVANGLQYQLNLANLKIEKLKTDLAEISQQDKLTGCCNQSRFVDEVARFIALNERSGLEFSLIRLSVDPYALILGRDGQRAANELLQVLGGILQGALREVDLVARVDEEQFGILLSGSNTAGAIIVANRIIALAGQISTLHADDRITVSMGLTEFHGTEDTTRLIQDAETALNKAMAERGNSVASYNYKPTEMT